MKRAKFETYRDRSGLHRWRLKARNGRIVAESGEGYRRRIDCLRAADWLSAYADEARVWTMDTREVEP